VQTENALNLKMTQTDGERVVYFVIPNGARNLSFFSLVQIEESFLAPLGMTKVRHPFPAGW
jgi:hypothetical protein